MSRNTEVEFLAPAAAAQSWDVRDLTPDARNALIVSMVNVDGDWRILSRYGDVQWRFIGGVTANPKSYYRLDFSTVPRQFDAQARAILFRYMHRGRAGSKRPKFSALRSVLQCAVPFLRYLEKLKLQHLNAATPMVCALYVHESRAERTDKGKPLSPRSVSYRFRAVEALWELSQYTDDPMPSHPWPETTAKALAGLTLSTRSSNQVEGKTPLIPDEAFCALFQVSWKLVEQADTTLHLRDEVDRVGAEMVGKGERAVESAKNRLLARGGFGGGLKKFNKSLVELRTACFVVVASLSGCRIHEIAHLETAAYYYTEDDDGESFAWMKSRSLKTDAGNTEWMIPEAAVTALKAMDRWAVPYQAQIGIELAQRRQTNPSDPEIAEALRHARAIFLGLDFKKDNQIRTLSASAWNFALNRFARKHQIKWKFSTHQFRRKFANYAARSVFGDLRYLKEHFKHWSFDMTLGYALNESQEIALYAEIQDELDDIKEGVVEQWLQPNTPLAGGLGANLVAWRGNHDVTLFKSHAHMVRSLSESVAVRSNGHAWCTADQGHLCIGSGGLDRTRCTDCDHAVIGSIHARMYQGLYDQLKEVLDCNDIGEGGLARVRRDLSRCRDVLCSLGHDPEAKTA